MTHKKDHSQPPKQPTPVVPHATPKQIEDAIGADTAKKQKAARDAMDDHNQTPVPNRVQKPNPSDG